MPRLTPATLDALEAALAKATPGEWIEHNDEVCTDDAIVGNIVCQSPDSDCEKSLEFWAANCHLIALAHNHLPALIAAARATVPEPIGKKHRDGNWWLVWEAGFEQWLKCRWREHAWRMSGTINTPLNGIPTHAKPMPPAPEGTDG
jgi:hypothetical protein